MPPSAAVPDDQINKVIDTLSVFHDIDPTMQASTALVLLAVAKHQDRDGGLTTSRLAQLLDASVSTTSRT